MRVSTLLFSFLLFVGSLQAQTPDLPEIKDIAPPFAIPLLPLWAVILLTVLTTLLVAALVWWLIKKIRPRDTPPLLPRDLALQSLQAMLSQIETDTPTAFSVEVAGVLRRFVMGEYGIPATRQTSQEFLQKIAQEPNFSPTTQSLLKTYLDKVDLIEFAKLQATSEDNRELWEKARQFVQGGTTS